MKDADTPPTQIPFGPSRRPWADQVPPLARDDAGGWLISPPSADPAVVYARRNFQFPEQIKAVPTTDVELPPIGTTKEQRESTRGTIGDYITVQRENFLGYQTEMRFDYSETLAPYLNVLLNNIGDPFVDGYFTVNAKFTERSVLDFYASLWNAIWPSEGPYYDDTTDTYYKGNPESYWGYVLTMGSSEGNLYGMLNARDYLRGRMLLEEFVLKKDKDGADVAVKELILFEPDAPEDNPNAFTPVAFYSEDTHYSIIKAMGVLDIATFYDLGRTLFPGECPIAGAWSDDPENKSWPPEVPSAGPTADCPIGPGSVDLDALTKLVEFFAAKGYPPIVVCNYGTTFKGAYDPVEEIGERLMPILRKYGLDERMVYPDPDDKSIHHVRTGYWFHVDGALGASYGNFLRMAQEAGLTDTAPPRYDFSLPYVHSVVTSGHKWPGAPWPTGIYMTKQKYMVMPPDNPEYVGSPDTTFAGSRNGFSAMILWQHLAETSYDAITARALKAQEVAAYAMDELKKVCAHWVKTQDMDLWQQRSPEGLSIIFRRPNDDIVAKYSLCTETVQSPDGDGERVYVHFFIMGDVEKELVDAMMADLMAPKAFVQADSVKPLVKASANVVANKPPRRGRRIYRVPTRGRGFR